MAVCVVAALMLLVAAFIAPGHVGEGFAIAAVIAFIIGLVIGGLDRD